ncbi:MAG: hypothetical protein ACFFBP_01125 [Promethearchaeota archaeon]
MIKILHVVYIVHQISGVCLVSERFSETEVDFDSDLISGYVVAFKNIGKEMSMGSGDLKIIK